MNFESKGERERRERRERERESWKLRRRIEAASSEEGREEPDRESNWGVEARGCCPDQCWGSGVWRIESEGERQARPRDVGESRKR